MIFQYGTVIGFLPNKPDFCYITNGYFTQPCYIAGNRSRIKIGKKYSIFKEGSLYKVGNELSR